MTPENALCTEHPEICDLMPWYVNGTLAEADRQKVEAHARSCAACRRDLEQERQLYRALAADVGLEYMPTASFKRLQASLGAPLPEAPVGASAADAAYTAGGARSRRLPRYAPRLAAASVAVAVVALALMSARMHWGARDPSAADYHTVTTSAPRPPDEVIRAVFSPTLTLVELQAILDEAQLRIVSGPTEAGVFSLAATSRRPVNSSLALLRRHSSVRFAERTHSADSAGAGESP